MTTIKHKGFQVVKNEGNQPLWWINRSELWSGRTLEQCRGIIDRYVAKKEAEIGFGIGRIVTNGKVAGEVKSLDFASNEIVVEVETHVIHPNKIVIKLVEHRSAIFSPATMRPLWKRVR